MKPMNKLYLAFIAMCFISTSHEQANKINL